MFCGPETVDVPEAKPRETSTAEGPQIKHILYCFPEVSVNKYFILY